MPLDRQDSLSESFSESSDDTDGILESLWDELPGSTLDEDEDLASPSGAPPSIALAEDDDTADSASTLGWYLTEDMTRADEDKLEAIEDKDQRIAFGRSLLVEMTGRAPDDPLVEDELRDRFNLTDSTGASAPLPETTKAEVARLEGEGLDRDTAIQQATGLVGKDRSGGLSTGGTDNDVYLRRGGRALGLALGGKMPKGMRDKTWGHADAERKEVRTEFGWQAVAKRADKYRKMVVRSVASMDEYELTVCSTHSLTNTLLPKVSKKAIEAKKSATELAGAALDDGTEDLITHGNPVHEQAKELLNIETTMKANSTGLGTRATDVSGWANRNHALSKEVVSWDDKVQGVKDNEALYTGPMARDTPSFMEREQVEVWDERVAEAFDRRTEARKHQNFATALEKKYAEWGLMGPSGWWGKRGAEAKGLAATGSKKGKSKGLELMSGGFLSMDEVDDGDGGTKNVLVIGAWVREFKQVKAQCAEIEAEGVYGDATKVYTALKMLAQVYLPILRKVANAIAYWATGLAMLTGGSSLGVAAAAGTISLLLAAAKAALELVLTVWSAKQVGAHTDRDARALRLAQAERMSHGIEFVGDTATAVIGGTMATSKSGGGIGAHKVGSKRLTDFDNSDKTSYGSVRGTRGLGATGGVMEGTMSGGAARGVATAGIRAKSSAVGSDGDKEMGRRDIRTESTDSLGTVDPTAMGTDAPVVTGAAGRMLEKLSGAMQFAAGRTEKVAAKVSGDTGDTDQVGGLATDVRGVRHAVGALE